MVAGTGGKEAVVVVGAACVDGVEDDDEDVDIADSFVDVGGVEGGATGCTMRLARLLPACMACC